MPPHGRRRLSNLSFALGLLFIFASTASAASSAVIGIDFGTEYIKAALVKPGVPLDIVLTKDSKRKETAAVAFKGPKAQVDTSHGETFPERIYGGDAAALAARFPKDVYFNLKPLLGVSKDSDVAVEFGARFPELDMVETSSTGSLGFKSNSFVPSEEPFVIEELLAMELKNIKANAESMAGKGYSVDDVVMTIPPFYTAVERRAITTAAELAGLRVLSLISDGLAVGLNYATSRSFPIVNEGGKPETHLVYDMGAGSTTATVLRFQARTVKDVGRFNKTVQEVQVLGTSWDRTLGGDALNGLILDDMVHKFTEQTAIKKLGLDSQQMKSHGRTMAKLRKESERVRQVLSANTETFANFEGLYFDEQNFKYKLSRANFEKMAASYFDRVRKPVSEALEIAKLTVSDIDSVILHGGAVRTPFVQKQLESLTKSSDKVRTNVNSDEAAVFGAGFKAATISPSFRVKEIRTTDSAIYPIFATWKLEGKARQQKLFIPTSATGVQKQVGIRATTDFEFELQQQPVLAADFPISTVKTQNLSDSVNALTSKAGCSTSDISTTFAIRLSSVNGLPEVLSGSVSCEVTESEKKGVVDGMKDFLGFGSRKDDQKVLEEGNDNSESTSSDISATSISESKPSEEADSSKQNEEKIKETKKKVVTIPVGLSTVTSSYTSHGSDALASTNKRLTAFDASDRSRVLREETLNILEGYTYKVRDVVTDEKFLLVSTPSQRNDIEQKASEISSWLYGDGADAPREILKSKLDEIRGLVKPIQRRKEESVKRPASFQALQQAITQADTMISVVKQQLEIQLSAASSPSTATTMSEPSAIPTIASDEFSDLDDESSTSATPTTTKSIPEIPEPMFSRADLALIEEKRASIIKWLDEKIPAQESLSATDDPLLLSSDLDERAKEISDLATDLLMKQVKVPKSKKTKTASKAARKTSSSSKEEDSKPSSSIEIKPSSSQEDEAIPSTSMEEKPSPVSATEAEPSPAQAAEEETGSNVGGWAENPEIPKTEEGMPSVQEQLEMRRVQQEIDEQLAAENLSIVAKAKANATKKDKKAKATVKPKSKSKTKGNAKSKGKEKAKEKAKEKIREKSEGHGEL
ncbi:uncharacterized protein KY384_006510 [Bacidia gigantensis]|uniref:uncharacterized protein n=1 Tax=Bacidia gigantensis TaxID=2732470 RepID=UPI001D05603E|nr:uncharacterized protein KY384_006510 [Bacidia gigantensis]KAG8528821.1 hypothetical protein KY384_006510 [Bacidia gigantensis]